MDAFDKTCTASQLIERLQSLIEKHGDLKVLLDDPDTGWNLEIGLVYGEDYDGMPERFEITGSYGSRPDGHF